MGLLLQAEDVVDRHHWRWLLVDDESGAPLADHQVTLDPNHDVQVVAFENLYSHVRWNADPQRRTESERELVDRLGAWIGEQVLGPAVRTAIVDAAPVRRVLGRQRRVIELEVLQYGVTRERLATIMEFGGGWDVLHLSGHGGAGEFLLEKADGYPTRSPRRSCFSCFGVAATGSSSPSCRRASRRRRPPRRRCAGCGLTNRLSSWRRKRRKPHRRWAASPVSWLASSAQATD